MTAPSFLADEDLRNEIVMASRRLDPSIDFTTVQELGLAGTPDDQLLEFAWRSGRLIVSHDVNTMITAAVARIGAGESVAGLLMTPQSSSSRRVAETIALIAGASSADEWVNVIEYLPW